MNCHSQGARFFENCPSETGTEGCQVTCWHLPRHFQKILLAQQWFALITESQTDGFKQSLSQWLMLSQLSDYIKLCNPGCCWGASDNSCLCAVRRRWDLLGAPLCAPTICLRSVTLGRIRISSLDLPLWLELLCAVLKVQIRACGFFTWAWTKQRPLTMWTVRAGQQNCTLGWERKEVIVVEDVV